MKLVIENQCKEITSNKAVIESIARDTRDEELLMGIAKLKECLNMNILKIGYGGHHIWIVSKRTNKRLAIIR